MLITANGSAEKAKVKVVTQLETASETRQDRTAKMVRTKETLTKAKLKSGDTRKELKSRVELRDGKYW